MSQDYVYACLRAELLGLPKPTEEEWALTCRSEEKLHATEDDIREESLENLQHHDESAQRVSGGLDELNSILSATQKKINRFKAICGSLGSMLKVTVGSANGTPSHRASEKHCQEGEKLADESVAVDLSENTGDTESLGGAEREGNAPDTRANCIASPTGKSASTATTGANAAATKKIDFNQKMGSKLDKLDSLIGKAENAQYSMQHQTKQMRKLLK